MGTGWLKTSHLQSEQLARRWGWLWVDGRAARALPNTQLWERGLVPAPAAEYGIEGEEEPGFLTNILRPDSPVPSGHLAMRKSCSALGPSKAVSEGFPYSGWKTLWWSRVSEASVGCPNPERKAHAAGGTLPCIGCRDLPDVLGERCSGDASSRRAAASLVAHHRALWTQLWLQKEPLLGYGERPRRASATVETAQWSINLSAINCASSKGKEKKKEKDKKRDLQFRHSSVCGGAVLGHFILNILFCYIFSFPSKWNSFLLFCFVPTYLFLFHFFNQRSIKKKNTTPFKHLCLVLA